MLYSLYKIILIHLFILISLNKQLLRTYYNDSNPDRNKDTKMSNINSLPP